MWNLKHNKAETDPQHREQSDGSVGSVGEGEHKIQASGHGMTKSQG